MNFVEEAIFSAVAMFCSSTLDDQYERIGVYESVGGTQW